MWDIFILINNNLIKNKCTKSVLKNKNIYF